MKRVRFIERAVFLFCIILFCIFWTGCSNDSDLKKSENSNLFETISSDFVIQTDYGDLHYPDQWREYVKTIQEKKSDTIKVTFEFEVDKSDYKLFEILIGGDNGEIIGKLTDNNGIQRNVYLRVAELPMNSSLDEAEQNRFYAMQEDLNYLIDNLK